MTLIFLQMQWLEFDQISVKTISNLFEFVSKKLCSSIQMEKSLLLAVSGSIPKTQPSSTAQMVRF